MAEYDAHINLSNGACDIPIYRNFKLFKLQTLQTFQTSNSSNGVFDITIYRDSLNFKLFKLFKLLATHFLIQIAQFIPQMPDGISFTANDGFKFFTLLVSNLLKSQIFNFIKDKNILLIGG